MVKLSFPGKFCRNGSDYIVSIYITPQMLCAVSISHLNKEHTVFDTVLSPQVITHYCMEMLFTWGQSFTYIVESEKLFRG